MSEVFGFKVDRQNLVVEVWYCSLFFKAAGQALCSLEFYGKDGTDQFLCVTVFA